MSNARLHNLLGRSVYKRAAFQAGVLAAQQGKPRELPDVPELAGYKLAIERYQSPYGKSWLAGYDIARLMASTRPSYTRIPNPQVRKDKKRRK